MLKNFLKKFPFSPRERIFIVPNFYGLSYLIGTLVILFFFYGNQAAPNNLALIGFSFLIIFIIGMIQTNDNLKGIEIAQIKVDPCAVGDELKIFLTVKNKSDETKLLLSIRIKEFKNARLTLVKSIPENSNRTIELSFTPERRGVFSFSNIQVSSVFPIGLFYSWKNYEVNYKYFIYPKPFGNPIDLKKQDLKMKNEGEEFSGHRQYRIGDSEAHIDWKAYARGHEKLIKEFEKPSERFEHLNWDDITSPSIEIKLSQLALWVVECHQNNCTYSLALPTLSIPLNAGLNHAENCLKELAKFGNP